MTTTIENPHVPRVVNRNRNAGFILSVLGVLIRWMPFLAPVGIALTAVGFVLDISKVLIWLAIPVFVLGMAVELWVLRLRRQPGYDVRDSISNILTGLGYQLLNLPWAVAELAILMWLYKLAPWHLAGWAAWAVAMVSVDLMYYWYHRAHHKIRALWAVHVVHHSSQRYNFTVALRTSWVVITSLPFLAPLALLGIDGKIIMASYAINLLYQFFLHTEMIDKLWRPVEFVFNTPSHHRAHHGSNDQYLDKNYGGILIIWDRLFGTFEAERARVVYGLTQNIETYNVRRIYLHEIMAVWREVRSASNLRDRLGYAFRAPGWRPTQ